MSDAEGPRGPNVTPLTAEEIRLHTGYGLVAAFTEFNGEDGSLRLTVSQVAELRNRLALLGGNRSPNVLPSFYRDEEGVVRLGIFERPLSEQPYVRPFFPTDRAQYIGRKEGRPRLYVVPQIGETALGPGVPRPRDEPPSGPDTDGA